MKVFFEGFEWKLYGDIQVTKACCQMSIASSDIHVDSYHDSFENRGNAELGKIEPIDELEEVSIGTSHPKKKFQVSKSLPTSIKA